MGAETPVQEKLYVSEYYIALWNYLEAISVDSRLDSYVKTWTSCQKRSNSILNNLQPF